MTISLQQFKQLLPSQAEVAVKKINSKYPSLITTHDLYVRLMKCDDLTKSELKDAEFVMDRIATHFENEEVSYEQLCQIINQ